MSSDCDRARLLSKDVLRVPQKGSSERVHAVISRRIGKGTERTVIGAVEEVTVRGPSGEVTVLARVDTGAARTSLDTDLTKRAGLGPVLERVRTRAAAAEKPEKRDVVSARLVIRGTTFNVAVAVTDRKDMRYHMIVGMDVLSEPDFLVDPREGDPRNGNNARPAANR